jgi:hypothetical protein
MLKQTKLIDKKKSCLSIIDKIEKVRAKNNANWMDILRLAVDYAPDKAINLMKKINKKDQAISRLFSKIK